MSAPTLEILAFSPPAVNGESCSLHVASGTYHVQLAASRQIWSEIFAALQPLLVGALPVRRASASSGSSAPGPNRGAKTSPERIAAYERVRQRVRAGASWRAAAEPEGIRWQSAYSYFAQRSTRAAAHAARAAKLA